MQYYISSRSKNNAVTAHEAIIKGLADDGGLYTPVNLAFHLNPADILHCSYQETALLILQGCFPDFSPEDLKECVYGAYNERFDSEEIVPLKKISDGHLMELWHGPTSAFKDLALTILPRLMTKSYAMEHRSDTIAILTATSGDTGKAALSGFADVPHTAVTVFYPKVGVSPIQKQQMVTSEGDNVCVIAVDGNFDDCQRMVKEAVSAEEVRKACHGVVISSANSINIGRLVPQIVYYCTSYAALVRQGVIACGNPVNFVVPTGNFGDILAGWLAKQAGLPIHKLICASNTNNVLTDFLNTGTYSIHRPFHTTMSPSMDILISSNLERLLFMASGYDDNLVKSMMKQLQTEGSYTISDDLLHTIRNDFAGVWTDEETCSRTIHDLYEEEKVLIDPHTSIALSGLRTYQNETDDRTPAVVLSTASPYKFCRSVYRSLTGIDDPDDFDAMTKLNALTGVPIPANLADLKDKPVRFNESIAVKDGLSRIARRIEEISHDRH
jgi:threonine synthase